MGTRADYYIKKDQEYRYLGSTSYDGYEDGLPDNLLQANTPNLFMKELKLFLDQRDDVSLPNMHGWPWPWEDSNTTDYAYCYDIETNQVLISNFGSPFYTIKELRDHEKWQEQELEKDPDCYPEYFKPEGDKPQFPNMEQLQNVTLGERSGILVI
ncbi:MAG: hypothetical protein HWN81_00170 [Candidatus Lokiarchaeota archaeon]|nr:hypothetical protein [Candidatus Lokiarchaeota archaeon]